MSFGCFLYPLNKFFVLIKKKKKKKSLSVFFFFLRYLSLTRLIFFHKIYFLSRISKFQHNLKSGVWSNEMRPDFSNFKDQAQTEVASTKWGSNCSGWAPLVDNLYSHKDLLAITSQKIKSTAESHQNFPTFLYHCKT